jgi:hypothetical protein
MPECFGPHRTGDNAADLPVTAEPGCEHAQHTFGIEPIRLGPTSAVVHQNAGRLEHVGSDARRRQHSVEAKTRPGLPRSSTPHPRLRPAWTMRASAAPRSGPAELPRPMSYSIGAVERLQRYTPLHRMVPPESRPEMDRVHHPLPAQLGITFREYLGSLLATHGQLMMRSSSASRR